MLRYYWEREDREIWDESGRNMRDPWWYWIFDAKRTSEDPFASCECFDDAEKIVDALNAAELLKNGPRTIPVAPRVVGMFDDLLG